MTEPSGREIVERYARAVMEKDFEALDVLLTDDIVEEFPQSRERIVGLDTWMALQRAWPEQDQIGVELQHVAGSDDEWVAGPNWSLMRVTGTGDDFWTSGEVTYPNGETWQVVSLVHLRDGRIAHIRSYFAAPFEPAEWRRPYVERMDPEA